MPEDLNQKISQLLDNELDHVSALNLLKKMQFQSELKDKMNRYEAISHALKTDVFLSTKADFSTKICQQIQHEPIYLLPQHKPFKRPHKLIALAASMAIVAVIAGRSMNDNQFKSASILQVAQQQLPEQTPPPLLMIIRLGNIHSINALMTIFRRTTVVFIRMAKLISSPLPE